jgi:hypothetical protein
MLWVAAFLALVIWVLGMASGFLGLRIHVFLLFAVLAVLAALLPTRGVENATPAEAECPADSGTNAKSVPGTEPTERSEDPVQTIAE